MVPEEGSENFQRINLAKTKSSQAVQTTFNSGIACESSIETRGHFGWSTFKRRSRCDSVCSREELSVCGDAGPRSLSKHSSNISSRDMQSISEEACLEIRAVSIRRPSCPSSQKVGEQAAQRFYKVQGYLMKSSLRPTIDVEGDNDQDGFKCSAGLWSKTLRF